MDNYSNIGELIKKTRKEKGYSIRELAKLCDISHTEISNIESGLRVKPAILTLKAFEKYLDLDFKKLAKAVGYSNETIEYGDNDIIVSFDRYDKKVKEFELEINDLKNKLSIKKHIGIDIKEYFDPIYVYLKSQNDVDKDLIKKADSIYAFIDDLMKN